MIDDVCTTGSTLEACAAPLFAAGARSVCVLVLARPMHQQSYAVTPASDLGATIASLLVEDWPSAYFLFIIIGLSIYFFSF